MKSKLTVIATSTLVLMSMSLAVVSARPVAAVNVSPGGNNSTTNPNPAPSPTPTPKPAPTSGNTNPPSAGSLKCTVLPQAICNMAKQDSGNSPTSSNSAVLALLQWVISILTAGVGIAAVAAFIYAGIMYSSADGSAEQVKKAKGVIQNTVIGLVVFAAMALVLQWIIPGGVF